MLFGQDLFDTLFDLFGTSCNILGGAVAEESNRETVSIGWIGFTAFFHPGQAADVRSGCPQLGQLVLLVLVGL